MLQTSHLLKMAAWKKSGEFYHCK